MGVHIRRGDKASEADNEPIDDYSGAVNDHLASVTFAERMASVKRAVQSVLETHNVSRVYVASDDPAARDELQKHFGSDMKVLAQPRNETTEEDYAERDYMAMPRSSFLQILVDIEALRRAEVFV